MTFYRTNILVLIFERSSWKNTTSSSSYPNKLIQIRKGKRILLKMRFTIDRAHCAHRRCSATSRVHVRNFETSHRRSLETCTTISRWPDIRRSFFEKVKEVLEAISDAWRFEGERKRPRWRWAYYYRGSTRDMPVERD